MTTSQRRSLSVCVLAGLSFPFVVQAQLSCPLVDSNGGAPGIQVTGSVGIDDTDDGGGNPGDFYNCTASLVQILAGATVTLGSNVATAGIAEIHFSDLVIEAGATVTADGQGYTGNTSFVSTGNGPGGGADGSGGGHGGRGGGAGGGTNYGSLTQPSDFGSAGGFGSCCFQGSGANGGGVVKLLIAGSMTLNGVVSSNGNSSGSGDGPQGGGAGGSVWIATNAVSGSGTIRANGGSGNNVGSGSGGGGRIAVHYSTSTQGVVVQARSGAVGSFLGGAGTIYEKDIDTDVFELTIDNGSVVGGNSTPIESSAFGGENLLTLTVVKATVPVTGSMTIDSDTTLTDSTVTVSANMTVDDDLTLASSALTVTTSLAPLNSVSFSGSSSLTTPVVRTTQALTIPSGTTLRHLAGSTSGLTIMAPDVTIASGGSVALDGRGFQGNTSFSVAGNGPGAGGPGSGGGYGGVGGAGSAGGSAGATYGSATAPSDLGSSGGSDHCCFQSTGGAGGGKLKIEALGTVALAGTITSNGATGSGNAEHTGGSGGSVWIAACTVEGSGSVSANGGAADGTAGAGGGGRISFTYSCANDFSGTLSVAKGTGGVAGADGTINLLELATLDVDGNGSAGALTDGILLLRYFFGFRGTTLTNGVVDLAHCTRCNGAMIEPYVADLGLTLDVDGNGAAQPLTDGLLALRYLFGFRGTTLTNGAVDLAHCTRCDAAAIEPYLAPLE